VGHAARVKAIRNAYKCSNRNPEKDIPSGRTKRTDRSDFAENVIQWRAPAISVMYFQVTLKDDVLH